MKPNRSCRWISSDDLDVDAFLLVDGKWILFAYVKSPSPPNEQTLLEVAQRFGVEKVLAIGGAHKSSAEKSVALKPVFLDLKAASKDSFVALEGDASYRIEIKDVLNPGLFLDQELNRQDMVAMIDMVAQLKPSARVLNLFCYTGAFSVAAARSGANQITSIDVSARYLAWTKENFALNQISDSVEHKVIREDARDFLKRAAKKSVKYDCIILDPPTFSRGTGGKKQAFQIQKEMAPMVKDALNSLAPNGRLLVSTNDSRWQARDFLSEMKKLAQQHKAKVTPGRVPSEFGSEHPLKSVWILVSQ